MEPHPEFFHWEKCPVCGFSIFIESEAALKNPYVKVQSKAAAEAVEKMQGEYLKKYFIIK